MDVSLCGTNTALKRRETKVYLFSKTSGLILDICLPRYTPSTSIRDKAGMMEEAKAATVLVNAGRKPITMAVSQDGGHYDKTDTTARPKRDNGVAFRPVLA